MSAQPSCGLPSTTSAAVRRTVGLAASMLVVIVALVTVSAPTAGAARATIVPTGGFPPRWAIEVGDPDPSSYQYGFAVDRLGNSYLADGRTLVQTYSPDGTAVRSIKAEGTGTLQARGLTVSADLEVTVVGRFDGSFTVGAPPHQATFISTNGGAQFMIRFDRHGSVVWSRTFGAMPIGVPNAGDINIFQLHQAGDLLLVNGQYFGNLDIDGITLDQLRGAVVSGLLAGFDVETGQARWLTAIDVADGESTEHPLVFPIDGAADEDRFAVVGFAGGDVRVRGATTTTGVACNDRPEGGCQLLTEVDPATGEPVLATALALPADTGTVENIALTDEGFAVAGDRWDPLNATHVDSFVNRLDAAANPIGSTNITGPVYIYGLEVDGDGDLVAAGDFSGTIQLGSAPDAPTITAAGSTDVLVVELDDAGEVTRWTTAGGAPGTKATVHDPALLIGPDDEIVLTGSHDGPISVGTGTGAKTLTGDGTFLASFPPDRPPPGSTFHPTAPTRLLDSRTSTGGWNGPLVAGSPRQLTVAGTAGVPADATAVVLNLTVTDVSAMTYLAAWPTGLGQPVASVLNVVAGDTTANQATVAVGADGAISLATAAGTTHVIADLDGYYTDDATGDGFHPIEPTRLLDSRTATGGWDHTLDAGTPRDLTVAGTAGIPADATTVVMSVTATDTTDLTFLRAEPTGTPGTTSNLNINAGQTITNLVTAPIGSNGQVTFTNDTGSVNVVADAVGYYDQNPGGSTFHPIAPTRVLDSRVGTGGPATPWGPGTTRTVPLAPAVPTASTTAIAANLTATDTSAMSFLTLFPLAPRPGTSNLLFTPGQTIASAATTGVAPDGTVSLFNQLGNAQLIVDLNGYFTTP